MLGYRFEAKPKFDRSTSFWGERTRLYCETEAQAVQEAQVRLKRLGQGISAKLYDSSGALIWESVAEV